MLSEKVEFSFRYSQAPGVGASFPVDFLTDFSNEDEVSFEIRENRFAHGLLFYNMQHNYLHLTMIGMTDLHFHDRFSLRLLILVFFLFTSNSERASIGTESFSITFFLFRREKIILWSRDI